MDFSQIINIVNEIFINVLDDNKIKLGPTTTANDVEEWSSLSHIELVVAIEKRFKIRFTTAEIQNWKNVGEMCETIEKRLKA